MKYTCRLSGAKLISYALFGIVNCITQDGAHDSEVVLLLALNNRHVSLINRTTLGKSTGRRLIAKNWACRTPLVAVVIDAFVIKPWILYLYLFFFVCFDCCCFSVSDCVVRLVDTVSVKSISTGDKVCKNFDPKILETASCNVRLFVVVCSRTKVPFRILNFLAFSTCFDLCWSMFRDYRRSVRIPTNMVLVQPSNQVQLVQLNLRTIRPFPFSLKASDPPRHGHT